MLTLPPLSTLLPAFNAGLLLSLSLIMALGPQNTHVLRMGLQGRHVWLTIGLCILSDALLIGFGVLGLTQLGALSDTLKDALMAGGIVFLLVYGAQAFQRFRRNSARDPLAGSAAGPSTRRQATLQALTFSWLNPHVWLDTAVLMGTASLAWARPANAAFALGATTGSVLWFCALGLGLLWLGPRLRSPTIWRSLDGLVALMMWGTALMLGRGLLGL